MTPSLLVEFVLTGPGFGRSEAASLVVSIPDGAPNQTVRRGTLPSARLYPNNFRMSLVRSSPHHPFDHRGTRK